MIRGFLLPSVAEIISFLIGRNVSLCDRHTVIRACSLEKFDAIIISFLIGVLLKLRDRFSVRRFLLETLAAIISVLF